MATPARKTEPGGRTLPLGLAIKIARPQAGGGHDGDACAKDSAWSAEAGVSLLRGENFADDSLVAQAYSVCEIFQRSSGEP